VVPASGAVTLTTPGTYYWQASYSGDSTNAASTSTCGSEVETVTGTTPPVTTPVTVTTSLSAGGGGCSSTWGQSSSTRGNHQSWGGNGSGGTTTCGKGSGQSGASISVPTGTAVTDSATLAGTDVAHAGGTVTYTVYSNDTCSTSAGSGGTVTVSGGVVPTSGAVTLTTPGTYYWQASYSGDSTNAASTSTCGSEVETVTSVTTCSPGVTSHPTPETCCEVASYGNRPQGQPPT
jgi:uncharacterized protein YaiE (UPF0345 family)